MRPKASSTRQQERPDARVLKMILCHLDVDDPWLCGTDHRRLWAR